MLRQHSVPQASEMLQLSQVSFSIKKERMMPMSEQDWFPKGLFVSRNPTQKNPLPTAAENTEVPESPGGGKQWMSDLQLQMEMSAQAASVFRRLGRR